MVKISSSLQKTSKIILGIDPGTVIMGYGLIKLNGRQMELIEMGTLKFSAKQDAYERLKKIQQKVTDLILLHKPVCMAIEAPFFGKNVQSMLKLGRAQGVAIASAMHEGLEVFEYSPKKIKQSVTGNGNAGKEQVLKMLQQLLPLKSLPASFDASDALAAAVCHHFQHSGISNKSSVKSKGWKEFLQQNPSRIKK